MELDKNTPQFEKAIQKLGIINSEVLNTRQASAYLTQIKNIPTAPSSLEVYRCTSRGPTYKRVGRRCYYTIEWLDRWAEGIEIKIFDHNNPTKQAA